MSTVSSRYEPAGFFLLRAPALPTDTYLRFMAEPELTQERVLELSRDPEVRHALFVASEDLVTGLDRLNGATSKKARRVHSRLLRYLTRMSTRPTPFGAFSGVAMGEFGTGTTAYLGDQAVHRTRVRTDMGWLLTLIKELEADPELLPRLNVVVNSTAHRSGGRLVLPYADVHGQNDIRAVRILATPAVEVILRSAATPIPYGQLVDELTTAFPDVARERVTGLVRQMWELNFLTSDLRPPQTATRPEQHLLKKLVGLDAAAEVSERLGVVADLAQRARGVEGLVALKDAQALLLPDYRRQTFQLDAAIDLRASRIDAAVGRAAADAVEVLLRLAAASSADNQHLARYREEFLERYGTGTRIPVLDVLSPDSGLDAPPLYTQPQRSFDLPLNSAPPEHHRYDGELVSFAQQAWWDRSLEVELTDEWLARLAPPDGDRRPVLPVLDAYLQIEAGDAAAVGRGEWRAVLRSDGLAHGGRTFARFFDLLGEEAVERLREYARREEDLFPEVAYAELAYLPTWGRAANVAVRPRIRPYEIPVNATPSVPDDRVVPLDDLLVGATEERFYLWSRRLDREVVVTQHHMLSPLVAPNAARFLLEVSYDGFVMPGAFPWGRLGTAPFLPRVTRGKVVLSPAQWRLTEHDRDGLGVWRERWHVPRYVYLTEDDNRLLLDLDHPQCVAELREELKPGKTLLLQEMLPAFEGLWLRDEAGRCYQEEVVVPLIVADAASAARPPVGRHGSVPVKRHVPGGEWSFLKVYAGLERQDEIIAGPLPELLAALRQEGLVDRWFYIRYADPFPHLRIRVRSADAPRALAALAAWGAEVVDAGLSSDLAVASYAPEIARYGGPDTYDAVEQFFEHNSEVSMQLIAQRPGPTPEHLAVVAVDTLYRQWGIGLTERVTLIPGGRDEDATRKEFQKHRDYLCELLSPWDRQPHATAREHRSRLAEVFAFQEQAARKASARVRDAAAAGRLVGTEAEILGSLAHMQINRLLPIDLAREERCYGLWRYALRAVRGRLAAQEVTA